MSTRPIARILARKAQSNANVARSISDVSRDEIGDEAFGAEVGAAIEKWLKALIAWRGRQYKYTHNIGDLLDTVVSVGYVIPPLVDMEIADEMTPFASGEGYEGIRLATVVLDRPALIALLDAMEDWVDEVIT